jgi:hypothetical protein
MELILKYLSSLTYLIEDLWIFFLIGFLVAGIAQEFVPARTLLRYFGSNSWQSLARASFAGLVVSVCSCGAIPLAATLRQRGASTAVALTFLLATPWAGFTHLVILSGFIGFPATALVLVSAIVVSFLTGLVFALLEKINWIDAKLSAETTLGQGTILSSETNKPITERLLRSLRYSFTSFTDIGKYLGIGLLLAAALHAFVPTTFVSGVLGKDTSVDPILLAIPLSAVIELCSEGFSVFGGQLYSMGATLGVVFVMLMVGVTTDFTELSVLWGKFGKNSTIAYVVVSTFIAFVAAHIIDLIWTVR